MRAFVEQRITAVEFETVYLALFKDDPTQRDPRIYRVLAALFHDVDDYFPGESDADRETADEVLRAQVMRSIEELENSRGAGD